MTEEQAHTHQIKWASVVLQ